MPSGQFGTLGDADTAARRFVLEALEAMVLRPSCPSSINIDVAFAKFLEQNGVSELSAGEIADAQRQLVRAKLRSQLRRWSNQGVPAPLSFVVDSDEIVISWRHERYAELAGAEPTSERVVSIYGWLGEQHQRAFLLPCVCFLRIVGCDPIFVTDGARDEGIDCIGLIASGGLRSTAVFVQARSQGELFAGDPLLQEYAKYSALPRTRRYLDYLEALQIPKRCDGTAFVYAVLCNSDYKHAAQQHAAKLGVLIRSRRQLAQVIAAGYTVSDLEASRMLVPIPASADLVTNLAVQGPV